MQKTKKAKLAHDKQRRQDAGDEGGRFTFDRVLDIVTTADGTRAALVDLDGAGTEALVSTHYVYVDPRTGNARSNGLACPAVYDPVARGRATLARRALDEPAAPAPTEGD